MAEAAILGLMQDLEISRDTVDHHNLAWERGATNGNYSPLRNLKMKIRELRGMLDFMSDLKMEEMSKLKYLMADFVEIAQDIADLDIHIDKYGFLDPETNIIEYLRFNKLLLRLRDEIKMIKMRIVNFGVDEKNIGEEEEEEVIVVGLEEDVKELVDKVILNKSYQYPFVTIKGMIGIGKTTFARQVYNHKEVVSQFERCGWVSFASDMSYKEVLLELIQQMVVGNEELIERDLLEEKDNRSLRQMLRQHLHEKRFIIVVDDLPKGMQMSYILQDLQDKAYGSRVLCTSLYGRIYSTISYYYSIDSSVSYIHEMKPLDSVKSWQLFLKTIDKFTRGENKFSKDLEKKGKEMLKKCWGLPIAIIDVGRQKAKQRLSGIEWEELFESIDLDESLKKLEPMYDELGKTHKACFLHMSLFKENAIMREEKLEQIWAASGVIKRTLIADKVVGKGPCSVLRSQSMIEVVNEFQFSYEVKICRIHPLLHMLSRKKAEDEMGFEILSCNDNHRPSQSPRHRVVQCGRDEFNHTMNQEKNLVSLIFHGGGGYLDASSQSYWKSFELLKILDMEDFGVKNLSETIGILTELRYLGLRNNYIGEIPHSFGGLKKLETFDIDLNFMVELPDIICEMGSLYDLHMSNVICRKPLQIDKLKNLKTLTYISIYDWTYEVSDLVKRIGLEKLGIEEVDENMEVGKFFASLAKLGRPDHLILKGFRFRSMPCLDDISGMHPSLRTLKLEGLLPKLPSADSILKNLSSLALVNTCLDEDPMPILEKLNLLERLKLQNAYTGREMVVRDGFRLLQLLRINELWNLRKIQVGKGGIQVLKELEIKNCPRLDTLPKEIESMKYLKKFKLVTNRSSPPIAFTPAAVQPTEQSNQEAKGNQARPKTAILPMQMGRPVHPGKKHAHFMDDYFFDMSAPVTPAMEEESTREQEEMESETVPEAREAPQDRGTGDTAKARSLRPRDKLKQLRKFKN